MTKIYLIFINFLDSNTISINFIYSNICIPKLTMTQQFPNRIIPIKILKIPKICSFSTRNYFIS
ncbi:hypothetical protein Hanom_Chr09g00795081 [Helianthus anomalus]